MMEDAKQNPNKIFDMKHVVEEGDLVVVHSHLRHNPEAVGVAVIHIFRFQDEKIVELWDVGQLIPEESPNEHGMF
mgnify:CR=1 FL=1